MFYLLAGDAEKTKYYSCIKTWLLTQIFAKFWFQTLCNMLQDTWEKFKALKSPEKILSFIKKKYIFILFEMSAFAGAKLMILFLGLPVPTYLNSISQ